jgi:dynein light intermediate chain
MEQLLLKRQARGVEICPVRQEIYSQCFDELIRQVTIDCPERGLLLLRIRDEIRMTMDAYRTLYDSSVTFGVKKQLEAQDGMEGLEEKLSVLRKEAEDLQGREELLSSQLGVIRNQLHEKKILIAKKRKEEIDFLKSQAQHLETFLKSAGNAMDN